jgi:hypothetical protein
VEVTEARRKWRSTILDHKTMGLFASLGPSNNLLKIQISACESFRLVMGIAYTVEEYYEEIGIMVLLKTVLSKGFTTTVFSCSG